MVSEQFNDISESYVLEFQGHVPLSLHPGKKLNQQLDVDADRKLTP